MSDDLLIQRTLRRAPKLLRTHHLLIAVVFTSMIGILIGTANVGMEVLTSMRAYVGGEGLWSKGQKDAVHYLLRYGRTRDDADYQRYLRAISVPLADHEARVELQQAQPDLQRVRNAFIRGGNHPNDVDGMIHLFRRYYFEPHIQHAIEVWTEADKDLEQLNALGSAVRQELSSPMPDLGRLDALLGMVDSLNEQFPRLENDFSRSLGDAARYGRSVVFLVLLAVALIALALGLFVSYRLLLRAREADERYRHLWETAGDGLIISDHETGIILDANPEFSHLTGITIEKLIGTRQSELFGREIPAIHGSSPLQSGDLVIRHADGASIPVEMRSSQGRFGKRAVDYSIVRDLRERRQFEEKMQEAARMESLGRMAGGVAHDFNNLLTVIVGYAETLKHLTTGDSRDRAEQIQAAARRAASLTSQLLAFSRKQPLQPQSLDLNEVIGGMEDMIRSVLDERIELELDLTEGVHRVDADPHQLEQILLNLCTNARDAMPDGGRLTIRTWNAMAANASGSEDFKENVAFAVKDTGHGMDEATQRRIFEPFFTTKPQGKGTGLGLATVFGTVKQSGGQISVDSKPGRGATFTILLPRSIRPVQEISADVVRETAGNETVLLVEDDPAVQETLAFGLRQDGYHVLQARNGWEALDLFNGHQRQIAIVITDLIMPELGGIGLGQKLQSLGAKTPVLYVTGYHQDLEKYAPQDLPLFGGFLLKPFTAQALARTIRSTLNRAASNADLHSASEDCA